ncbi:MAG: sensor histidine kinase [Opitutales bacterium]
MSIFLGGALLLLLLHYLKLRRILRKLEAGVRSRKRMLFDESPGALRRQGLDGLVREYNRLIDEYREYADEASGYNKQVEATLGSIQEAVVIFDAQRLIEFANESAQHLFNRGRPMKGLRLEAVMRSAGLLELLEESRHGSRAQLRQIQLEQRGGTLWFEASCVVVRGVVAPNTESTLLVLHDITRLKSLEMMRRDFVANVSHELRTPLTVIKGFAETLVEDDANLPVESRARFLEKILSNAQRLNALVEDLLTLSRLESKPEQAELATQSLHALFEETAEANRPRLDPAKQAIVVDFDESIGPFAFDRFRMSQVLDNLVENAFRYAPEFTCLTLRARRTEGVVECAVIDDGPGIPEKDVPHVFERFYRVDRGRSRERGGTGLGLSITKHIVQLHGGAVRAESRRGEGTAIYFTLPVSHASSGLDRRLKLGS